jgi:rhodanese-related sulfurtransferase
MKHFLLSLFFVLSAAVVFGQKSPKLVLETASKPKIEKAIETGEYLIIDVRMPHEYAKGHIKGAVNIDYLGDDFSEKISKIERDQKIIVYCAVGGRSEDALRKMGKMGFNHVLDIKGGYYGWTSNN